MQEDISGSECGRELKPRRHWRTLGENGTRGLLEQPAINLISKKEGWAKPQTIALSCILSLPLSSPRPSLSSVCAGLTTL